VRVERERVLVELVNDVVHCDSAPELVLRA
jgi:hypothetical protein